MRALLYTLYITSCIIMFFLHTHTQSLASLLAYKYVKHVWYALVFCLNCYPYKRNNSSNSISKNIKIVILKICANIRHSYNVICYLFLYCIHVALFLSLYFVSYTHLIICKSRSFPIRCRWWSLFNTIGALGLFGSVCVCVVFHMHYAMCEHPISVFSYPHQNTGIFNIVCTINLYFMLVHCSVIWTRRKHNFFSCYRLKRINRNIHNWCMYEQ
jgi:hypothetical protein